MCESSRVCLRLCARYVHVCMCGHVCVYVCVCAAVPLCVLKCVCVCVRTCVYARVFVSVHIYACVCVFLHGVWPVGTHMESKLSREVVHATGVHETKGVPHGLRAQNTLPCDWAESPIGQGGCHDTGALTCDLDGAQLLGREGGWLCRGEISTKMSGSPLPIHNNLKFLSCLQN